MGIQLINTLSGQTTGTIVTVDYTPDFTLLNTNLTTINVSLTAIASILETNLGATGQLVPGTLSNSARTIMKAQADGMKSQAKTLENINQAMAAIGNLSNQVAALSNTVAQGVATQQIAVSDQIKKNKFDQTATQAALERNGLPAVEVTTPDLIDSIRENAQNALEIASAASVAGIAQNVASTAITKATTYITGMLPSLSTITEQLTGFLKINTADIATKARVTEATTKAALYEVGGG